MIAKVTRKWTRVDVRMRLEPPISSPIRYDPLANTSKALEEIGAKLQRQYETWQPRARYKQSLDPTVDEIRKVNRMNGKTKS